MLHTPALLVLAAVGAMVVLSAYAAPATESRSELVGQKTNAEGRDDLEDEDEAVDKRRFRGVKRSDSEERTYAHPKDSEEKFEERGEHPKHRDVERLLRDTGRVKGALKELMAALRELDRRAKHREHKPEEAAAPASQASASASDSAGAASESAGAATGAEKPTDEQAVPLQVPVAEGAAGAGAGAESRRSESVVDKVAMMAKRREKRRSSQSQINVPMRWG